MGTVAEVIDSRAFLKFCGVDSSNQVPDGDALGRFRHILEENSIQKKLFAQVVQRLTEKGLILKKETIVDSTIIESPSSAKNKKRERDPDVHQVKKGNNMVFTSNKNPSQWQENFCENDSPLCALDRIFDDAVVFTIKGESYLCRKLETVSLRTATAPPAEPSDRTTKL